MTEFTDVDGCCTALHMNGLPDLDNYTLKGQLQWIKETLRDNLKSAIGDYSDWERRICGFALIFAISTDEQHCEETLPKLGFEKVFTAEKSHDESREEDSGPLVMWCVQPWDLLKKREQMISELEGKNKPSEDELKRRQSIEEFRLVQYRDNEIVKSYLPEGQKNLLRRDTLPTSFADRNRIFGLVQALTGGYEPGKDHNIVALISKRELTWGALKDRACAWRNGEFL